MTSHTANDNLRKVIHEMRRLIDRNRIRCLSSLLFTIGHGLLCDEIGLIEDDFRSEDVIVRRKIPIGQALSVEKCGPCFSSMVRNRSGRDFSDRRSRHLADNRCEYRFLVKNEASELLGISNAESGYWMLFVPVWPTPYWKLIPRHRFWIYVANPMLACGDASGARAVNWEILRCGIEWFAWKHDRLASQERSFEEWGGDWEEYCNTVRRTIVRPVMPAHFSGMLQQLVSARNGSVALNDAVKVYQAMNQIYDITNECAHGILPKGHTTSYECIGCGNEIACPQTERHNDTNRVITKLLVWETLFWKLSLSLEEATSEFRRLLEDGLTGLREAAQLLESYPDGPIDLHQGKERMLLRFILTRAILHSLAEFERRWNNGRAKQLSELDVLARMAAIVVLVLVNGQWQPKAIRNLIRLMSGFGHEVLGVPGWIDLGRHLRQSLRGESALHTLKRRYRDHFFHTIEVCFIGYALLVSRPDKNSHTTLAEVLSQKGRCIGQFAPVDAAAFLRQWWIASLLHDTAYGIDVLKGTLDLLSYFKNDQSIEEFLQNVNGNVKDLHRSVCTIADELPHAAVDHGDHGIIAGSHLLATARRYGQDAVEEVAGAARAIAFHNTRVAHVDGRKDPLAALLILCDTVQDWGRSQLGYERSATVVLSRLVSSAATPEEDQFGPVKKFSFAMSPPFHPTDCAAHVWDESSKLRITLEYATSARKEASMLYTWVDATFNLERIDISSWGVDICIDYRVPIPTKESKTLLSQLAEISRVHEAGFVKPWLEEATSGDNRRSLWYRLEATSSKANFGWEVLTFNIGALGGAFRTGNRLLGLKLAPVVALIGQCAADHQSQDDTDPAQRPPV